MREYALLLRDVCAFVCLDDKHKIKIGKLCGSCYHSKASGL